MGNPCGADQFFWEYDSYHPLYHKNNSIVVSSIDKNIFMRLEIHFFVAAKLLLQTGGTIC